MLPDIHPQGIALADQSKTDKANAEFRKLQRVEDGKKAMSEYEAEREAIRAKTARLRALRLARDAAEQEAQKADPAPAKAAKKTSKGVAKKAKKPAGTLSDWLNNQQASGRRS
jgi:hypothetical protein